MKYKAGIGVLCHISSGFFGAGTYQGVSRMLGELKYTFDVINETMDFSKYKLLIIPDSLRLSPTLKEKVSVHLASGKSVLSTGIGGFGEGADEFALPQWNFQVDGMDASSQAFYKYEEESFRYAVYVPGIKMYTGTDSKVIAKYYKAYFNKNGMVFTVTTICCRKDQQVM